MAKITFPVEAGHIMLFARAIGDTNPVFRDAEAAMQTEVGGIIAELVGNWATPQGMALVPSLAADPPMLAVY